MAINVKGVLMGCKHAVPAMRETIAAGGEARGLNTRPIFPYLTAPPPVFNPYTGFKFRMWRT